MRPIRRLNAFRPTIPTKFTSATLATQSANTHGTPSAEWAVYPPMYLPANGFASDFQSNGPEVPSCPTAYTSALTGLGIRYIEPSESYVQPDSTWKSFSTTTGDHFNASGNQISLRQISGLSHFRPPADGKHGWSPLISGVEDLSPEDCNLIYPPTSTPGASWYSSRPSVGPIEEGFQSLCSVTETSDAISSYDLFNAPMAVTPPMAGPFVDINMFEFYPAQEPPACVDPADTICPLYVQDSQEDDDPDSPCPPSSSISSSSRLGATMDSIVPVLTTTSARGDIQASVPVQVVVRVPDHKVLETKNHPGYLVNSDDPPKDVRQTPSPAVPTPTPSLSPSPHRPTTVRRPKTATRSYVPGKLEQNARCTVQILPGTPVLDAHRGIELMDLIAKAERYRLRNPGQNLSKQWLASFAGKLSSMGELIDDFRCYVVDCSQKNKRRDHILIHVGSHVDQRPFPCGFCPMRFLRKNEWKRHEASHTGEKPFVCNLCHCEPKAFVRQDLLSQHMKRTHGISVSANKENGQRSRKKAKLEYF